MWLHEGTCPFYLKVSKRKYYNWLTVLKPMLYTCVQDTWTFCNARGLVYKPIKIEKIKIEIYFGVYLFCKLAWRLKYYLTKLMYPKITYAYTKLMYPILLQTFQNQIFFERKILPWWVHILRTCSLRGSPRNNSCCWHSYTYIFIFTQISVLHSC